MANNDKENKIEKFTKEAIGKTLNQFNKEIGMADLVEINKNQDRILNGILSQVNDENTEKTEKSNIITLDNSTDGIVELKEIQGDTNVNVSKIEEMPITHDIGDKEGNVFTLNEIPKGAISIGEIQGNTMVNCNKDDEKELVLMKDLSTQGDSNVTLNKGVDGGLVDVALEGNTMVNVCDQKDPVAITKSYTVETGNHVALQGEYDGKCRPVVTGNTLVNLVPRKYSSRTYTAPINHNMHFYDKDQTGCLFKPSTTYTYIVEVLELSFDSGAVEIQWGNTYSNKDETIWNNKNVAEYTSTGIYRFTLTTKSSFETTYKENRCYVSTNSATSGNFSFRLTILEGDYTNKPIPGYFEGLQSSFEDKVVPENLCSFKSKNYDNSPCFVTFDTKVKPNTKYTLYAPELTDSIIMYVGYSGYEGLVSYQNNNKVTFTTGNSTKNVMQCYYKKYPESESDNALVKDYVSKIDTSKFYLVEGDYTNYDFSDYDPTKAGKYKVDYVATGKNKFDKDNCNVVTSKYLNSSTGEILSGADLGRVLTYYPILPNITYTISKKAGNKCFYALYDKDKVFINGAGNSNNNTITLTTSNNTRFISFYWTNEGTELTDIDLQIEEGTVPTTYEPYKEYTKTFYLNSPLLEGDTIEQQGNNVVHVHRSEIRAYETDDELTLPTDMTNTLVAKATSQYEVISQNDTILCDSYVNGHLDVDSVVPIKRIWFRIWACGLKYLYPSTQYNVQFESDNVGKIDIMYLGNCNVANKDVVKGINKFILTTPDTLSFTQLQINGIGFNASNIVVTQATDQDFGYFEGMKSVGECEGKIYVASNNGNLFEGELIPGRYTVNQGTWFADNTTVCTKEKIKVNPNTRYKIILPENVSVYNISEYSCDIHIKNHYSYPFTTSPNATHINISLRTTDINTRFCLVKNDSTINIDTAQSNAQQLTHEPLRAVGESKDKYVLLDGKWYIERRCGSATFDGSNDEGWRLFKLSSDNKKGYTEFRFSIADGEHPKKRTGFNLSKDLDIVDNISPITCNQASGGLFEGINLYPHTDTKSEAILVTKKCTTVDELKIWLSNNNTTLIYQLASPVYEEINYNPLEVYSDITHISINSVIPTNMVIKNHGYNCLLKPSTTYTVSSNLGLNTVTTGADIGDSCLRFYDTDTSDVTTMKNVLLLEGDWTSKADLIPSNFSGIESCFEQALVTDENDVNYGKYKVTAKVVGKNLFDKSKAPSSVNTGMINVRPNTTYYFYGKNTMSNGAYAWLSEYDLNGERIAIRTFWGYESFTTNQNTVKITLGSTVPIVDDVVIALTEATEYEPYKESDITFYIDEPLRGIGDVKDKVYVKDNKVVVQRNCIVKTVDGSENGWEIMKDNDRSITFMLRNDLFADANSESLCTCNLFKRDTTGGLIKADNSMRITEYSGVQRLFLVPTKEKCSDLQSFKQWLQQNPVTVVYQLDEPTYEEVEYSSNRLILNTFNNESFNNSTLFLDTNISPKLSFKPLYEELVYVKNSTKYYIQFNAVGSGEVVINLGGTELTTEIAEGYNCIPITTPSESTNLMTISGQGITISEVVVSEVICGGYYKGLQSCFEEHMENGKYRVLLRGIALDGSKVNGIKLYINEPLRGVEDTKDRLCIKNGKLMVERKCSSVTLDGSPDENWVHSADGTKTQRCSIRLPLTAINGKYLCDRYEVVDHSAYDKELLFVNADNIYLRVPLDNYSISNVKKYLQQNPVTVVYQLAEPTYEEATNEYGLPIVFEGYENGIVYIDSAVTPTTHIKYTSNNQLATTLAEAEEQNIATQEDINMNVITYMMDIDMMLTDMEMSNDISVMAVRRDSSNENMLDRMSDEDKKVYRDNTVVMLEKMITANVLDKEDIEGRIDMYYNKNRISKEQYKYLKSLL